MKLINESFNDIALEESLDKIKQTDVYEDINGKENHLISFGFKKFLVFIACMFVPALFFLFILIGVIDTGVEKISNSNLILLVFIELALGILIFINIYIYWKINIKYRMNYLNNYRYRLIVYLLLQFNAIAYGSIYTFTFFDDKNWFLALPLFFIYLIIMICLSYLVIKNLIKESINERFDRHLVVSKWISRLNKLIALAAVLIFAGLYLYRTFKAYFILNHIGTDSILNGVSHVIVLIAIMIVVLLPTLIFDSEVFVRGELMNKYSEEFREDYNYTKDNWYGEDNY